LNLDSHYFKPQGRSLSSLEVVVLTKEEIEAMRLKNLDGLDQNQCAERMQTSQATVQRLLSSAYRKVSQALVLGQALKIID
jgi:predicted DNA-binding protein (UPF0251 family)